MPSMIRRRAALVVLALGVAGCAGLKEALTNHVDVVAQAGSAQLTSAELAQMMVDAEMPPRKDLATAVANLWVNYQLLAQAAAKSDTMADNDAVDEAMWAQIAQSRLRKFQNAMQQSFAGAPAGDARKAYEDGVLLAARHILISADKNLMSARQLDSARRFADNVRRQVTPENFVQMVSRYSGDPGSKNSGGEYVFPAGMMVPEFEAGTRALKPGEISQPIQTNFGFHIIMRETYEEAKVKFDSAYRGIAAQSAESAYVANIDKNAGVKIKDGAAATVKKIAEDVDAYRGDRTVLVTSRSFDLRAARVALWIAAFPPQMQIRRQLQQAPDSIMPDFLNSLMRNELMLLAADSAKVIMDEAEMGQVRGAFRSSLTSALAGLGILPAMLADSAKTNAEREELANRRIAEYMKKLLKNEVQFVDVSEPVSLALRRRYEARVAAAGIDRTVTKATELKAVADSAQDAAMPSTAVPMPGAPPAAGPDAGTKAGAPESKKQP